MGSDAGEDRVVVGRVVVGVREGRSTATGGMVVNGEEGER